MRRGVLAGLIILVMLGVLVYAGIGIWLEYNSNMLTRKAFDERDVRELYAFYIDDAPVYYKRPVWGNSEAPITIIAVIDLASEDNREFYQEMMPLLEAYYINTGEAKLFHRYHLPEEEYVQKKARFIYAKSALCYTQTGGDDLIGFHGILFDADVPDIPGKAQAFGADKQDFIDCMNGEGIPALAEDMRDTELYRMWSPSLQIYLLEDDPTVLPGVSTLDRLNRTIRFKQIRIGI